MVKTHMAGELWGSSSMSDRSRTPSSQTIGAAQLLQHGPTDRIPEWVTMEDFPQRGTTHWFENPLSLSLHSAAGQQRHQKVAVWGMNTGRDINLRTC